MFESLSKTHQRSKLFKTRSVQYGHRYLRFVYLDFFLYRWPQVMSISWPPRYNSMVKKEVPLMRIRSAQIIQNHIHIDYAWYPRRAVASFPRWKVIWGHIMTSSGRQRFLPITFDRNELETWGWCHSVRLVKAHRLTCNMTYLGHTVTLTWRDLRSNFKLDLSRIKPFGSIRLDERNTMVSKLFL